MRLLLRCFSLLVLPGALTILLFNAPPPGKVAAQQPTGSIPTVTSTPVGRYVTVTYTEQINIRSGPSTYFYPAVGVLLVGETAPAIGRSPGGEWIQIRYPGIPGDVGWVYAPYVSLSPGPNLPIVEPPPTPTPITTPTIDPTLAAAFLPQYTPTRLPTFTPPPPLAVPTYENPDTRAAGMPMGLVITLLALIGGLGSLISFLRGR
ncbi:MAG: SH3 domain-containing protein [Anaerolineales bacterium]|nr:SH3 domain-containing protein [Anaerolineales bacterium]MCX7753809.1 SH3 domain-containing protein [Anaerolineales bacterium]MDW8276405.1 SH3 domain-containing protein [Anaerolineales bacterium]